MLRRIRIAAGCLIWAGALLWALTLLTRDRGAEASTFGRLVRFFAQREIRYRVTFARPIVLRIGDSVEIGGKTSGEIDALLGEDGEVLPEIVAWARSARFRLHEKDRSVLHTGATARLVQVPQAAAWVVQTLFTEENIPRIAKEWNDTMLEHREEIFAYLIPIVRDVILDVERHVEAALPGFLKAHEAEVQALGEKMKRTIGREKLADIFEKEIWPVAQPKLRPVLEKVSREIWEKLPLWSFTWRLAYQALPLTDNDHLTRAWMGFLEEDALPVFKSHTEEIFEVVEEITREAFTRDEVMGTLRQLFAVLLADPEFHRLSKVFLQEVILDNGEFHQVMLNRLRSPEVQRALEAAGAYIEPMVRRMGDVVLGTRNEGITAELSRVLRSQILLKDLQRLVIDPGPVGAPLLPEGTAVEATIESELKR